MALIAGVDDSGRGPVIGPMVLAGVSLEEHKLEELQKLGVKDSKLLSKKQREELFDKILDLVAAYKILVISPQEIDDALGSDSLNLNWLEAVKFAEIINVLKPRRAIVDCPSPNIPAYTDYLRKHLSVPVFLQCEHKADTNHYIVGAASILAKVTRDKEIEILQKKYGDLGSGYPSDPLTQKFIQENWQKHPEIFRKSWAPYQELVKRSQQKQLEEY